MAGEGRIVERWDRLAREGGERVAVVEPDGRVWTRREVEQGAEELAGRFGAAGLRAGRRLVMAVPNGVDWLAAFLACLKLRAVAILADWGVSSAELRRIGESQRAQAVWDGSNFGIWIRSLSWAVTTRSFWGS